MKKSNLFVMFWIFTVGGVLGYFIETIWCYFAFGGFSSRTSNFFFPFSIVWAFGAVIMSWYLKHSRDCSLILVFIKGCILSALFEFLCGYIGEAVLGVTFWDYRGLPLHIGKYVNVFISLLWGVLAVLWKKYILEFIEKKLYGIVHNQKGLRVTYIVVTFMLITNMVSGLALLRMGERKEGKKATNVVASFFDQYYSDHIISLYFPKMKEVQ